MPDKCTIHSLDLYRLKDEVESPALASLVRDGWCPLGTVVLDDGQKPVLHIIFGPPEKEAKNKAGLIIGICLIVELAIIAFLIGSI